MLSCLRSYTVLPIKSIRIGLDGLTNTSRGVCYVEMNSVVDSMFLHNQLLGEPPTIDDRLVSVSYYREPRQGQPQQQQQQSAADAALAAAQWSHKGQQQQQQQKYTEEEVERLAEYSAGLYAKTEAEKRHYLEYYRGFYRNGGAAEANEEKKAKPGEVAGAKGGVVIVDGVEYKKYRKYITPQIDIVYSSTPRNTEYTKRVEQTQMQNNCLKLTHYSCHKDFQLQLMQCKQKYYF